jgi:NADH dehydrogenase
LKAVWYQPVSVGDLAGLAVSLGEKRENIVLDAVGPEIFPYRNMVESIREAVGGKGLIMKVPPSFGLTAGRIFSGMLSDVVITRDEITGLMAGLLFSSDPPTCHTKFSEWLRNNKNHLGLTYRSELRRHYNKIAERHI